MALPGFSSAAIENPEAGGVSQTPIAITFLAIDTHNAPGGLVGRGHELATVFHGLSGPHAPGSLGYLGWKPRPAPANHWGGRLAVGMVAASFKDFRFIGRLAVPWESGRIACLP